MLPLKHTSFFRTWKSYALYLKITEPLKGLADKKINKNEMGWDKKLHMLLGSLENVSSENRGFRFG